MRRTIKGLGIYVVMFLFVVIASHTPGHVRETEKDDSKMLQQVLIEVNEKFTYKGKPIHPGLVREFEAWLSDGTPTTISVDILAAESSNEYYEDDVEVRDNGFVRIKEEHFFTDRDKIITHYEYKWLGKLKNNLHVLDTLDWGGGSGIFEHLLFVKFDVDEGFTDLRVDGNIRYNRLLMTVVRVHHVGDRDDGEITVLPEQNKVILGKSRYRKEPVILTFK